MFSKILDNFKNPDNASRIMMRWWWFGPAVTEKEIIRQLKLMKNVGIGGVELAVMYPLCLDNEMDYMSERFLTLVAFAAKTAKRLKMRFDLTLCSGWPFGGPHIPLEMSARKLYMKEMEIVRNEEGIFMPGLDAEETLLKAFCNNKELSVENNSVLVPETLESAKTITLIISSFTKQMVKRAALGAEGLVVDHYRKDSINIHLKEIGQKLIDAVGHENIHAIFTDSLEVFGSNWTESFFDEFKQRKGYDLEKYLQLLFGDNTESSQDIRHDFGQTLTEMLNDNFIKPIQDFAAANKTFSRMQAYGTPPGTLRSYRYVDLPEGEATNTSMKSICRRAGWTELTPNRIAASASKHYGRGVTSAETWTFLHSPPYAATLLDMKAEADQFFLQGVNHIIGHGWPYSPEESGIPGWNFYAAGNFNQTNSSYPAMNALGEYLQRVSSLLRMGKSVVDIGIYLPDHDVWASYSAEKKHLLHTKALMEHVGHEILQEILTTGYNFELIDDDLLQGISEGNHQGYPIILLPNIERIPLDILKALKKCTDKIIVAYKSIPHKAIGFIENRKDVESIKKVSKEIFDESVTNTVFVKSISELKCLNDLFPPDVKLRQNKLDIGYVHRCIGESDIYYSVNTSNRKISFSPEFKVKRENWLKMDPMTGNVMEYSDTIELAPFESVFIIGTDDTVEKTQNSVFTNRKIIDISKEWDLTFSCINKQYHINHLTSWTEIENLKNYSGETIYSKKVEIPDCSPTGRIIISLGMSHPLEPYRTKDNERNKGYIAFIDTPVKDAAIIYVNGQEVRTLFSPPYKADISKYIKTGENFIEIKVYNRLINKLSAEKLPDYQALNNKYGQRFDEIQDFDVLEPCPSGLTGNIKITIKN